MKLNWGYALTLVFIVFGSMIGYLVYRCSNTSFDLVTADYYKDELVYQNTIDGERRAALLSARPTIGREQDMLVLRFPGEMKHSAITGNALFYCAADARRDRTMVLHPGDDAVQQFSSRQLLPGKYIVKISWNKGSSFYYSEQPIEIH